MTSPNFDWVERPATTQTRSTSTVSYLRSRLSDKLDSKAGKEDGEVMERSRLPSRELRLLIQILNMLYLATVGQLDRDYSTCASNAPV